MKEKNGIIRSAFITGASFTGYNIGSGFATGMEATQFFVSWGARKAAVGLIIAFFTALSVLTAVYVCGFEKKFDDSKKVYRYFCGEKFGAVFDGYMYISMILITLTLISGAGATVNQYCGIPVYAGSALMGAVCIATSLIGLKKLRSVLSYLCVPILVFIVICGIYAASKTNIDLAEIPADEYAANGLLIRSGIFGIENPWLSALSSAGLLINSGFAWASATGALCTSRKEAAVSGILSSLLFYAASAVVVFLVLVSIDKAAGTEVPMLAVTEKFLPALTPFYSLIIVLAIFSTVSGRLFLIGERYGGGSKKRSFIIVTVITVFSCIGASFIPFSRLSSFMFSVCGAAGIIFGVIVFAKVIIERCKNKSESGGRNEA